MADTVVPGTIAVDMAIACPQMFVGLFVNSLPPLTCCSISAVRTAVAVHQVLGPVGTGAATH